MCVEDIQSRQFFVAGFLAASWIEYWVSELRFLVSASLPGGCKLCAWQCVPWRCANSNPPLAVASGSFACLPKHPWLKVQPFYHVLLHDSCWFVRPGKWSCTVHLCNVMRFICLAFIRANIASHKWSSRCELENLIGRDWDAIDVSLFIHADPVDCTCTRLGVQKWAGHACIDILGRDEFLCMCPVRPFGIMSKIMV